MQRANTLIQLLEVLQRLKDPSFATPTEAKEWDVLVNQFTKDIKQELSLDLQEMQY